MRTDLSDKVSRREWFAAIAMAAIIGAEANSPRRMSPELRASVIKDSYALADAMVAESEEGQ